MDPLHDFFSGTYVGWPNISLSKRDMLQLDYEHSAKKSRNALPDVWERIKRFIQVRAGVDGHFLQFCMRLSDTLYFNA